MGCCCCYRSSLQKYSPLEWSGYFDREDDIRIPDTEDVSSGQFCSFTRQAVFFFFLVIILSNTLCDSGVSCISGRNRRASCFLSAWRWLFWVCLFHYFAMLFFFLLLLFICIAVNKSALPIFFFFQMHLQTEPFLRFWCVHSKLC